MKISIDTLPLWDAFRQTECCPFCSIESRLESLFVDTYLGDAVMESDVRIEVNRTGFCREHYRLLYTQEISKLGLALMTHTHLQETIAGVEKHMQAINRHCEESTLLKRATGARDLKGAIGDAEKVQHAHQDGCVICQRTGLHMERYYETACDMWARDKEFATLFDTVPGFCLPHWSGQLTAVASGVVGKGKLDYIRRVNEIQRKTLSALEQDLSWFTQKFDYKNTDKPWGNAKDALPRAINTLMGRLVDEKD